MQKDYSNYTANDFLFDDDFIKWKLFPSDDINSFWETFISNHPEKKEAIDQAIKVFETIELNNYILSPEEKKDVLNKLVKNIHRKKKTQKILYMFSAAASIATLLICSYFFMPNTIQQNNHLSVIKTDSVSNSKDIQLILADSQTLVFSDDATIQYQNGNVTVNSGNTTSSVKVGQDGQKLNKLIVPKGKRSSLILADGSKIWINSGTTLEYPTVFDKKKREINIDGEIYIEVAKNKEKPFFVKTPSFAVEVLGTRFNVSAYSEDASQYVVLVEGSVKVKTQSQKTVVLLPDEMLNMFSDKLSTKQVNVYDYISWKDGLLQFQSEPLGQILSRLSRYYDTTIVCEPGLQNMKCTGKLILFDDFEQVLQTISNTIPVKYERRDNQIIIK